MGEGSQERRIAVLDGFRALAILLVVGYHYFVRWAPPQSSTDLYPYGDRLASFPVFRFGYLGVELFFIISGFVISLTLYRCASWADFAWKRFSRLFPTMLFCSVITFVVLTILAYRPFTANWVDFLPSLTFTEGTPWSHLLGRPVNELDGVYWSLQVEVKFYVWACLLFFIGPSQRFALRFLVFLTGIMALHLAAIVTGLDPLRSLIDVAAAVDYLPWFAAGVGFYQLFVRLNDRVGLLLVVESLLITLVQEHVRRGLPWIEWALVVACFWALFTVFILRPAWLAPLSVKPMVVVGAASYSLYLLHQEVGVSLIMLSDRSIGGLDGRATVLFALVVGALLVTASIAIYRYWEVPAKGWLLGARRRFRARRSSPPVPARAPAPPTPVEASPSE